MKISNSLPNDIEQIFSLYDCAIEYQKQKFDKHWLPFEKLLIEKEIFEKRQWKITINNEIACIFLTAENDPLIWGSQTEPAVYIHRIVTNPAFRGNNFVSRIVEWARDFGKISGKKYIRMDTWGDNHKLIDYYVKCGFNFLGVVTPTEIEKLPRHYEGITLALFEMEID